VVIETFGQIIQSLEHVLLWCFYVYHSFA
jgi:hypothetical protein